MRRGGELRIVAHRSVGGRVLHDGAELAAREFVFVVFIDDQFDSERFAARQHVERLREDVAIDEELVAALLTASRERSENIIAIASAAAVPSSSSEQLPISMPVSEIMAV